MKRKLEGFIRGLRLQFATVWAMLCVLGAVHAGITNWTLFGWSLFGLLMAVFACHFLDEAIDWRLGRDLNCGGMGIIREGIFKDTDCIKIAICFLCLAGVAASILFLYVGVWLLLFIIIGAFLLATNHIHETILLVHDYAISLAFVTAYLGSYFIQKNALTLESVLIGLFIFFIIVGFIPWQDLADYEEDKKHNKKTIIVGFGYENAGRICILHGIIGLTILVLYFLFA